MLTESFIGFIILALLYYFLYYRPKRAMSDFALRAQSLGYKTKLL